ncbi:MAG: type II and III secretion system protein family protein [Pseudomonadota bacterium]
MKPFNSLLAATMVAATALPVSFSAPTIAQANGTVINIASGRTSPLTVEKGKPKTIRTERAYYEVVIGDPGIATVEPLTNRSFYVIGNSAGTTGIAFFDENQRLVGSIDLEVSVDTTRLRTAIRENVPDADIDVSTTNGQLVLRGSAPDAVSADLANEIAERFADDEDDVINSVSVTSSQQVQLNVRFVEVNRNAGNELGVNWDTTSTDNVGFDKTSSFTATAAELFGQIIGNGIDIDFSIKALEERGVARRLAEPNLVTRSGEEAEFLAGGEVPITLGVEDGVPVVEYREFGIGLKFKPVVLKDGLISLDIEPEVSSIDTSSGSNFPTFLTRRAKTSVDLKSGQTFMIAGLYSAENSTNAEDVPGIGRVPILGALFSSKKFQRQETDLVMLVTPHLVKPIDPTTPVALPTDNTRATSVAEAVLSQLDEVNTAATGQSGADRTSGHILTLDIE